LIIENFLRPALLLAGAAEGSGGFLSNPGLWRVINLLVFVLILIYILRNKIGIGRIFDNRAASIVKELEQARREKQEAEARLAELESRLGRLDDEIAGIRAESERESAREAERISQAAAADAEKIRQTAHREIEGAVKAARTELRAFVAETSVEMAGQMIAREIGPEDNARMVNKYMDELGEVSR
jgi:F-type H+-transporting ATPase subunit b